MTGNWAGGAAKGPPKRLRCLTKEREVVSFLLSHKYVFGDKKGKLQPFAQYVGDLLW